MFFVRLGLPSENDWNGHCKSTFSKQLSKMDISRKLRLRFLVRTAVSAHFRKHFRHNIGHVLQKTNKQTNKRPDRQKAKLIEKKRLNCPFGCVSSRAIFLLIKTCHFVMSSFPYKNYVNCGWKSQQNGTYPYSCICSHKLRLWSNRFNII